MSFTEKILIPFINKEMKPEYVNDGSGFIGCYTKDKNRPYMYCHIFLVYEFAKGIGLYDTFKSFSNFCKSTCLRINDTCYYMYIFSMCKDGLGRDVVQEYKDALRGLMPYKQESAVKLLSFWSLDKELSSAILKNTGTFKFEEKEVPEQDYQRDFYEIIPEEYTGLTIKKTDS